MGGVFLPNFKNMCIKKKDQEVIEKVHIYNE
jgi:hypothetical protein